MEEKQFTTTHRAKECLESVWNGSNDKQKESSQLIYYRENCDGRTCETDPNKLRD